MKTFFIVASTDILSNLYEEDLHLTLEEAKKELEELQKEENKKFLSRRDWKIFKITVEEVSTENAKTI